MNCVHSINEHKIRSLKIIFKLDWNSRIRVKNGKKCSQVRGWVTCLVVKTAGNVWWRFFKEHYEYDDSNKRKKNLTKFAQKIIKSVADGASFVTLIPVFLEANAGRETRRNRIASNFFHVLMPFWWRLTTWDAQGNGISVATSAIF